uniref:Uncharacterized protein n=1 Tax=Grammatophora oceanica TaxID=210454 RepID=A0A7S1V2G6_9STRA|mmetsp:Transcript_3487/g.4784  ORF Transcript_3487/g.4784 Transcript_3487/m.4784 type:complete len:159 (+) Transcript_3487:934-1410(+)
MKARTIVRQETTIIVQRDGKHRFFHSVLSKTKQAKEPTQHKRRILRFAMHCLPEKDSIVLWLRVMCLDARGFEAFRTRLKVAWAARATGRPERINSRLHSISTSQERSTTTRRHRPIMFLFLVKAFASFISQSRRKRATTSVNHLHPIQQQQQQQQEW